MCVLSSRSLPGKLFLFESDFYGYSNARVASIGVNQHNFWLCLSLFPFMSIADSISGQGLTDEEEEYLLRDIEENYFGLPNVNVGEYPTLKTILDADEFYPAHGKKGNNRRRVYSQRVARLRAKIKTKHAAYLMILNKYQITPHSVHSSILLKKESSTMPSTRSAKSTKGTKYTDDSSLDDDEEASRMPPVPDFVCKSPSKSKPRSKASKAKSSPVPAKKTPKKGISTLDPGTGYHTIDVYANAEYPERNVPLRIESFSSAPFKDTNTNERFAVAGYDIYFDNADERWVRLDAYKAVVVSADSDEDAQMVEVLLPAHPYDEIFHRNHIVNVEQVMKLHDERIEEEKTIACNELMKDKSCERLLIRVHFEHLDVVLDNKLFSPEHPRTIKLHLIPVPHIPEDPHKDEHGNLVPTVINHIRWRVAVYEEEKRIIDGGNIKADKEGETSVSQARAAIKGMVFTA